MAKLKHKGRILKAVREQLVTYKGAPIRISSDFSTKTFQARRDWHKIFKGMKSKDLKPRLLYLAKLSFKIKGEIKSFPDKKKLQEFVNTTPVLQKNVKGIALRRRGRKRKTKLKKIVKNKMALNAYVSIITLNLNCLNVPIKRHRVAEWIRKKEPCIYAVSQRHTSE